MAGIQLSQPNGAGTLNAAGAQHPAPVTIEVGILCQLSLVGASTATYRWTLTKPGASSSVLSSRTSAGPSFMPDVADGAYSISLFDVNENEYVLDIVSATSGGGSSGGGGGVSTTVDTYEDARAANAFSSPPPSAMIIQCRADPGDGAGGLFVYDSSDTTTADNDGTVLVLTDGSRIKRIFSGSVDPRWFGAVPGVRSVTDAAMSAASAALTSATAAFTSADVGKAVSVFGAVTNTLTGTVATTDTSRRVLGTGTKFLEELWVGATMKIGATTYTVTDELTGTVATTSGNATLTGTGTKFTTELWDGAEISIHGIKYAISGAPGSDTTATLAIVAKKSTSGITAVVALDQTHVLVTPAASATASGLAATGPAHALVTTITAVGGATSATLADTAGIAVSDATVYIGNDSSAAFAAARTVADDVVVHAGSYFLASGLTLNRERIRIELTKGVKLYLGNRFVIDNKSCSVVGHAVGVDFTHDGAKQPNIYWAGDPGSSVVRLTESDWASGAHVRGLLLDANGVQGMTGFLLGKDEMDCSGVIFEDCASLDMQIGMNIRAGAQQNFFKNVSHIQRDAGSPVSGVGLLINGDSLVGSAAVTATWVDGGHIQGYRTGVQIGGPFGNGPAVVSVENLDCEGFPESNACAVRLYNGGVLKIGNFYTEDNPSSDGSNHAFEIGAPGTRATKVIIDRMYVPGFHDTFVGYGWEGLVIRDCVIDSSGVSASASDKACGFRNVGGGTLRQAGKWGPHSLVVMASDAEANEVDDYTGFSQLMQDNTDSSNVVHPRADFELFHADEVDGSVSFVAGSTLTSAGATFNWRTPTAEYANFQTLLGLLLFVPTAASAGTTTRLLRETIRGAYWDGAESQDFPLHIVQYIDDRGTGGAGAFRGRFEFEQIKPPDANDISVVHGFGVTESNELYLGPTEGTPPLGVNPHIALGKVAPEGVSVGTPGSIRTTSDGVLYIKLSGTGNTGWSALGFDSTSGQRLVRAFPVTSNLTEWGFDEFGRATCTVNTGSIAYYALEVPQGATLTNIVATVKGGGNADLPAVMPRFRLRVLTISSNAEASSSAAVDASANVTIYNDVHTITLSGLSETVNNENERHVVEFVTESGANATANFMIIGIVGAFDLAAGSHDRGAS